MRGLTNYCVHCGKPLEHNLLNGYGQTFYHEECFKERKEIKQQIRNFKSADRWKLLMEDPEVRKKIEEIDKKIIENIKNDR